MDSGDDDDDGSGGMGDRPASTICGVERDFRGGPIWVKWVNRRAQVFNITGEGAKKIIGVSETADFDKACSFCFSE